MCVWFFVLGAWTVFCVYMRRPRRARPEAARRPPTRRGARAAHARRRPAPGRARRRPRNAPRRARPEAARRHPTQCGARAGHARRCPAATRARTRPRTHPERSLAQPFALCLGLRHHGLHRPAGIQEILHRAACLFSHVFSKRLSYVFVFQTPFTCFFFKRLSHVFQTPVTCLFFANAFFSRSVFHMCLFKRLSHVFQTHCLFHMCFTCFQTPFKRWHVCACSCSLFFIICCSFWFLVFVFTVDE